ncbi:MAG: flippase, partial [Planctomycetaceae bacterium]
MPHNEARRVSKNTLMLMFGTACRLVFSFAFVIYVASLMGLESFGSYSLGIHYFELFLSLTATAIGIFITREAGRRPARLSNLLTHALVLVAALAVVSAGLMVTVGSVFNYAEQTRLVLLIASLALLPASAAVVLEAAFVALEQAQFVTSGTALESVLRIVLSYAALSAGYGLASLFWILVFTRLLLAVFYGVSLARRVPLRVRFRVRRFRVFAWRWRVFAVENWLATIYTTLDVVILSVLHGEAAVGLYTAAGKVVRLGSIAAKCYTTAVFPVMSRRYAQSQAAFEQLVRDTLRILLAVMLPAATVAVVLADRVMGVLFAERYAAAIPVLQVLAGVMLLECLNPFLSHTLFAKGQQSRSMKVAAIGLVVNTASTIWFASQWGAVGAACGTLVGSSAACISYCLYSFDRRDIYQLLSIAAKVSLAAAALALVLLVLPAGHVAVAMLAASVVYLLLVVMFRVITATDL